MLSHLLFVIIHLQLQLAVGYRMLTQQPYVGVLNLLQFLLQCLHLLVLPIQLPIELKLNLFEVHAFELLSLQHFHDALVDYFLRDI